MGLYSRYVLPRVVHLSCSGSPIAKQRTKVVPRARGRVLEVGIGSGLNLPFYDPERVSAVCGLEPAPEMARLAEPVAEAAPFDVELVPSGGEEIPLDSGTFDTVVLTYTLCTIEEPLAALREMARVLAPGGRLLFIEHGLAPDADVRRWQRWANPVWKRLGGGCTLDRDIPALLRRGGFTIRAMETMYIPGWRPATYNYWGEAAPD
jgi:ubiquinone/menaquinone biosynthesis C-methylase UbiE